MSQRRPRLWPRWSVLGQPRAWLIAGLRRSSSRVSVGPPLLRVRPSAGSRPLMSPLACSRQVRPPTRKNRLAGADPSRLWPFERTRPKQLAPLPRRLTVLRATIVFFSVTVPRPPAAMPPPRLSAWLSAIVALRIDNVPATLGLKSIAPPLLGPWLATNVLLTI